MRRPNCSERDVALAVLGDADHGLVDLSAEERDCLARVALAALIDECLSDEEFSAVETALQRAEHRRARDPLPTATPARRRRMAALPAAVRRAGRRLHTALRRVRAKVAISLPQIKPGRHRFTSIMIGAAAIAGPIYFLSANPARLQLSGSRETATGKLVACPPSAQSKPGRTDLVALQQEPMVGKVGTCTAPGAAQHLLPASHHS